MDVKVPSSYSIPQSSTSRLGIWSHLPARPRFVPGLVVVPVEDGLLIDGTDRLQLLKLDTSQTLIPRLIALMDGSRTLAQLEDTFQGVPREHVRVALSKMLDCGLVEDFRNSLEGTVPNPETLAFLCRHVGVTRANSNGLEAYLKLDVSEIAILNSNGPSDAGELLRCLLEKTGTRSVEVLDRTSLETWRPQTMRSDGLRLLISFCLGGEDREWHRDLDDWCYEHKVAWLRVVIEDNRGCVDIGPLFQGAELACFRCFCQVHLKSDRREPPIRPGTDYRFWASLVAVEVTYLLTQIGPVTMRREFHRYYPGNWQARQLRFPRVPGCSRCRPLSHKEKTKSSEPAEHGMIDTAVMFEDCSDQHGVLPTLRMRQEHSHASVRLSQQAKRMFSSQQYTLDRSLLTVGPGVLNMLLGNEATPAQNALTIDQLKTILLVTGGIRDLQHTSPKVQRWAATAGNLGSVELFAAVRDVKGLQPGLYFYQPREHSLADLRWKRGMPDISEFMRRVVGCHIRCAEDLPDVLVLFTGAFRRVAQKYGTFAYRLINLDAGAALSQFRMVARSLNLWSHAAFPWADDLLEEQLNLEPFAEQATVVAALSRRECMGFSGVAYDRETTGALNSLSEKPAYDFCDLPLPVITEMLFRESRTSEHQVAALRPAQLRRLHTLERRDASGLRLPLTACGGPSVVELLAARSSVRWYLPDSVLVCQITTILASAHNFDAHEWPTEHLEGEALNFLVLACRVEGLDQGLYEFNAATHTLSFVDRLYTIQQRCDLFVQKEFALAPLVIWIVGNLAASCYRRGALGHRHMLLRAGAAGHRLWMTALAMGLSGCIVAGVSPSVARRQLALDGYRRASLLAVAVGYEGSPTGEPTSDAVQLD